jgi:hypothetical protein
VASGCCSVSCGARIASKVFARMWSVCLHAVLSSRRALRALIALTGRSLFASPPLLTVTYRQLPPLTITYRCWPLLTVTGRYLPLLRAVALLLDSGADLQATNNYLDTPLHFAAREGHLAATTLLVERGADTGARTKFDVSPLEWAKRSRENEWQAVVAVLEGAVGGAAGAAGGGGDEGSDGEAYGEL